MRLYNYIKRSVPYTKRPQERGDGTMETKQAITIAEAEARAAYRSNRGVTLDGRDADVEALAAALLLEAEAIAFEPDNRGTYRSRAAESWRVFFGAPERAADASIYTAMPCECPPAREAYMCAHGALVDAKPGDDSDEIRAVMDDVYTFHRVSFARNWNLHEPRLAPVVRMWIDLDGYGRAFISKTKPQRAGSGTPVSWRLRTFKKLAKSDAYRRSYDPESKTFKVRMDADAGDLATRIAQAWRAIGR